MILGTDISAWQRSKPKTLGDVNFQKMKAAGSNYCFFRAYFGTWKDVDFDTYWGDCQGVIPRSAYYFPLTTSTIKEQTQLFVNLLRPDKGEIKPVIDMEPYLRTVPNGQAVKTATSMVEDALGVEPIIYTGKYVWRDEVVGGNDLYFANYDLWLANYDNRPLKPTDIPAPWTNWTFHQFGEGKGKGLEFGVESLDIDQNWFNGDQEAFDLYLLTGVKPKPVDPVPDPVDPIAPGSLVLTANQTMNVRSGPGIRSPKIGELPKGSVIKPTALAGSDVWVQFEPGRWTCIKQGDTTYFD